MAKARWLTAREQQAWRGLITMQDDLSEFLDRRLRTGTGLSSAEYPVLAHLAEAPGGQLRAFELGRLLRWEKSRLSQQLTRMQNRGLVARERAVDDQRGMVVSITPEGSDVIKAAAPRHAADVREAFIDHLTEAEMETLIAVSEKVRAHLSTLDG